VSGGKGRGLCWQTGRLPAEASLHLPDEGVRVMNEEETGRNAYRTDKRDAYPTRGEETGKMPVLRVMDKPGRLVLLAD